MIIKPGIVNYLTWQVANCTTALDKDNRSKYSDHTKKILKLLLATRLSALNHLHDKSENQYTHNDWAQCMNITNLLLIAIRNHTGRNKIPVRVAKLVPITVAEIIFSQHLRINKMNAYRPFMI